MEPVPATGRFIVVTIFVKHDLKGCVEVFMGRNLDPPPPPQTWPTGWTTARPSPQTSPTSWITPHRRYRQAQWSCHRSDRQTEWPLHTRHRKGEWYLTDVTDNPNTTLQRSTRHSKTPYSKIWSIDVMMNFLLLIIQTNLEQYTEKISISVELHKWNTKIKLEYIYKLEFDEKFGKINFIQIFTVSSCFTFLILQGIGLKAFFYIKVHETSTQPQGYLLENT
jgi:hypothetical protein